jgi:hypothetical protein
MDKTSKTKDIIATEYQPISLFSNPVTTLSTLFVILYEQLLKFFDFLLSHKILIYVLFGYLGLTFFEGKHTEVKFYSKLNKNYFFTSSTSLMQIKFYIFVRIGFY